LSRATWKARADGCRKCSHNVQDVVVNPIVIEKSRGAFVDSSSSFRG
jgi:hypothetical protein